MRIAFVIVTLAVLIGGTAFSLPYLQETFPRLQALLGKLTSIQQGDDSKTVSFLEADGQSISDTTPPVAKKKLVYQWKDEKGNLRFTESPPSDGRDYKEMLLESKEPSQATKAEKDQRVADYKQASKTYRTTSYKTKKPPRGGSSRGGNCAEIKKEIKRKERTLSSGSRRAGTHDKVNSELRELRYKSIKGC